VWRFGTVDEFLDPSPEESAYIDIKLNLSSYLEKVRSKQKLTQIDFSKTTHLNQSCLARIETGDPTLSLDLIIQVLLALGVTRNELARIISP